MWQVEDFEDVLDGVEESGLDHRDVVVGEVQVHDVWGGWELGGPVGAEAVHLVVAHVQLHVNEGADFVESLRRLKKKGIFH